MTCLAFLNPSSLTRLSHLARLLQGNVNFRRLVSKYKKFYICAQKFEKRQLVGRVVNFVRRGRHGGRFLQQDKDDGMWYEIGDDRTFAKIAQLLREGASAASLYRELVTGSHGNQVEQLMKRTNNSMCTAVASSDTATNVTASSALSRASSNSSPSPSDPANLNGSVGSMRGDSPRSLAFRKRNVLTGADE
jgi:hypothetical protein